MGKKSAFRSKKSEYKQFLFVYYVNGWRWMKHEHAGRKYLSGRQSTTVMKKAIEARLIAAETKAYETGHSDRIEKFYEFEAKLREDPKSFKKAIASDGTDNDEFEAYAESVWLKTGAKDRVLWLSEADIILIQQWREKRRVASEWLFSTHQGGHIGTRYVRQMVSRYADRAGIEKRVHPHLLRHTMATDLYRQSKDIRLVQKVLGHSSITTTTIYTHLVDDDVEQALKGFREAV